MSLNFILFVATLAVLLGFLYIRAGKKRGGNRNGDSGDGGFFSQDSGSSHCNDSGGDCGGDGGGGGD